MMIYSVNTPILLAISIVYPFIVFHFASFLSVTCFKSLTKFYFSTCSSIFRLAYHSPFYSMTPSPFLAKIAKIFDDCGAFLILAFWKTDCASSGLVIVNTSWCAANVIITSKFCLSFDSRYRSNGCLPASSAFRSSKKWPKTGLHPARIK